MSTTARLATGHTPPMSAAEAYDAAWAGKGSSAVIPVRRRPDGRSGRPSHRQAASGAVTYTTRSRMGCRLPCEAWLDDHRGWTVTLEEHRRLSA